MGDFYITVPKHVEIEETPGQTSTYTAYVVNVKHRESQTQWTICKRYKEFSDLYFTLTNLDVCEDELTNYKFPNKSIWNTQSDFTKQRRKKGFEELLRIVSSVDPMPRCVQEFLDVDTHMRKERLNSKKAAREQQNGYSNGVHSPKSSNKKKLSNGDDSSSHTSNDSKKKKPKSTSPRVKITPKDELNASRSVWYAIPILFFTTSIYMSIIFSLVIYLEFINVKNMSQENLYITVGSLCTSITCVRAILKKRTAEVESASNKKVY